MVSMSLKSQPGLLAEAVAGVAEDMVMEAYKAQEAQEPRGCGSGVEQAAQVAVEAAAQIIQTIMAATVAMPVLH